MRKSIDDLRSLIIQAQRANNWNDVVVWTTELLKQDDKQAWAWANRGVGLGQMGFPLDAILNYDRALSLEQTAIVLSNKGAALFELERSGEAIECYNRALLLDDTIPQTHMNIGHVYKWDGDLTKALTCYHEGVMVDPNYADGHLAFAVALLKAGNLEMGWRHYEWRWRTDQLPPRGLKQPQWRGEDLTGKNILVYAEQGLGDTIQFARYARLLAKQFPKARVIIEARQPLKRLLETLPEIYAVINQGDRMPEVDYVVPMLTLTGMMTRSINEIHSKGREYSPRSEDIERWAEKLKVLPKGLRVGICWAGMSRTEHPSALKVDQLRSSSLETFAPLLKVPGAVFVSLQKGPPAAERAGHNVHDFTEDMYDFYETCCAIENLDLVISVDTAVLHAAASLGKATWLLSRWDGCWRWFGDREDSPWYPSLRQFVQPVPHDWDGMVQKVASELAQFVRDQNQPELDLTIAK